MKSVSRIILFLLISISAFSQGICDLTAANGIELGDFDVPAAVCIGENFDAKDKSGGTGIKYIFGYSGQPISALPTVPSSPGPNASWAFAAPGQFVVLQYGRKNNKDMYRCRVVTVRATAEPVFTTSACNSNFLSISIADTAANNFSSYVIDWGDGFVETVSGTLPIKKTRTYITGTSGTQTIKVEGRNGVTSSCPSPPARTVNMNGGTDYPNIKTLELSADNQSATITFTGASDKYDVYQRSATGTYTDGQYIAQVKPGTYKFNLIDPGQSCFKLFRDFGCKEGSGEVCTTKLEVEARDKTNILKWQQHPSGHTSNTNNVQVVTIGVVSTIKKEEVGGPNTTISSPGNPHIDPIDCTKKYCYQVETKVNGTIDFGRFTYQSISLSPKVCADRAVVKPDPITESIVSVKDDNSVNITIEDNSPWTLLRQTYFIYRIEPDASLTEINNSPTITPFADNAVDASTKSFCYKIAFTDECGSTSELSPALCTINLAEGTGNSLQWTNDSPFGAGIITNFEVISFDELTNVPSTEATKNGSETTYAPQLQNFQDEAKYRIKAISASGKESFSNIYIIPLEVKLFLPDAFTPNQDNVNDNLEIKGSFRRIQDFEFQVFNRWGNPVFTSTDPTQSWDGKFAATLAPVDTYSYRIYAKLRTGEEVTKSGKFLLIR
jgi:gliding motility-associated-like protein